MAGGVGVQGHRGLTSQMREGGLFAVAEQDGVCGTYACMFGIRNDKEFPTDGFPLLYDTSKLV